MSKLFARNAGNVDRIIRVIVGALLVGNSFTTVSATTSWCKSLPRQWG